MATLCAQCDTIVLNCKLGPLKYLMNGVFIAIQDYVTIREYVGLSELNSAAALAGCAFCKLIWRITKIKQGKAEEQFSRIICSSKQIGCGLRIIFEARGNTSYEYLKDSYTEPGSD